MAASRVDRERARRRAQERRRAVDGQPQAEPTQAPLPGLKDSERARLVAKSCVWCGGVIEPKATGRIPQYCSSTCRHRAWEQRRAAASGRSAVEVVERRIEVPVESHRDEWPTILDRLAAELDSFRVYDRDLRRITASLSAVIASIERRELARQRR